MSTRMHVVAERMQNRLPAAGHWSVSNPCLPSSRNTGPAATAARNSPFGSDQLS